MTRIVEKELSYAIVSGMYVVHGELGFGFVEPIYARSLQKVLTRHGLHVEREVSLPVMFQGEQVGYHRVDMLINDRIVVEIKSTERVADAAFRQLRSYVAAMKVDLGILLHFGPSAKFYRVLSGYGRRPKDSASSANSGCSGNSEIREIRGIR